ncbi:MAG: DUF4403 family protein [Paludibacter sp.]|nr:DUF4403 family protein [Paludibacter sp.]
MKKTSRLLTLACVVIFSSSCKTLQIEKPKESYLPSNLSPVQSEFPLKVDIDVKQLEVGVNSKMNGLIFDGSKISDQDLQIKVWKAQDFSFLVKNNVIEYRVPLKIWSRFAWKVEKFGYEIGDNYEAEGSIALKYKTTININKDWKLVSQTVPNGYEWIEAPKLKAIGVNVPISLIANMALARCDKLISAQIDKSLTESVDLKKYVSQAWSEVQKPRLVSAENDLWIRITPKDFYASPITSVGNHMNIGVTLYGQIESFMGVQPSANALAKLPEFRYVNRPAQQFNLNIATDVTYEKISEMAKKELINKTFTEGKKTITIKDLSIFGSEGKAIFVADVTGTLNGRVYFNGNMVYNPTKMAVEITDPEFDVKTKNALVKSANWLLHGVILKQLTPYLTYPVKADIEKMKAEVNKMMENYPVFDGVTMQGKLNEINVTSLNLVPGALRIQANVKGNIAMKIANFKF